MATSKVQELLTYLLLHRRQALAREAIAATLWEDAASAQSKKNLRQALWHLQAVIDERGRTDEPPILVVEPDWVYVNPASGMWLDVAVFEQAVDHTRGIAGHDLDAPRAEALTEAADLYQGDLLEGCYEDWCLFERERLQNEYVAMLDKLMAWYQSLGRYELGLTYGERVLRINRAHERTHRGMMRMRYLDGDRTGAIQQFERCVSALDRELGVEPGTETLALYGQIRADRLDDRLHPSVEPMRPSNGDVVDHLEQLRAVLLDLRRHAEQGIDAIELVIKRQSS
jgi:DNA-binding SARP family transcriptional activator